MTIPSTPFSDCDCCGYGFEISIGGPDPNAEEEPETIPDECAGCPPGSLPRCWEFAVAGVTNVNCGLCNNLNATFIVDYNKTATVCRWQSDPFPLQTFEIGVCRNRNVTWILNLPTGELTLISVFTVVAHYTFSLSGYVCGDPIVATRSGAGNSACTNYPATLTLIPALCP